MTDTSTQIGTLEMATVLLIEDEVTSQRLVQASLSQHQVLIAGTLADARAVLKTQTVDFIILDVQLPDGDGFSFFMEIEPAISESATPIVFLTGRQEVSDKVTGYSLGADDYITKPIHPVEFRARIEGKIRKHEAKTKNAGVLRKDGFVFSLEKQTVAFESNGQTKALELTTLEFKLFLYLIKHKGHVLSREKLIADVWGGNLSIGDRTIDTHVSHLRKHLLGTSLSLQSVYGAGYRLNDAAKAA